MEFKWIYKIDTEEEINKPLISQMKIKSNKRISIRLIAILLISSIPLSSCGRDRDKASQTKTPNEKSETIGTKIVKPTFNGIEKINFYFENSGSMNGYLDGKNFKQTMHRIIDDSNPNLFPYFVNSKEYPTSNILQKIDAKNIKTQGTNSSDHQFIFTNAIKNAVGNNLSMVVTDGIYSTPNGDVDIVEIDIEKSFVTALNENSIETVILKLSSNYKGTYYTESECKDLKIAQERPYYILLFGNKKTIDDALKTTVVIKDLPGFKEQARFFLTDNLKVDYTILKQGEEKIGSFNYTDRFAKVSKEIKDTKRSDKRNGNYLQFGIAIDYSNVSIPDSYLIDKENYKVDNETGYNIEEIKILTDLTRKSTTYKSIDAINTNQEIKLTHLITVKANANLFGELKINLENNLPSWILETGIENDCEIRDNISQTFAFDKLMIGISKAYNRVSDSDKYLELTLNIKI
jgi:hypothetical protein